MTRNDDMEYVWRRFHRDQARRERLRNIRSKVIVPAHSMKPQMMVKNIDGSWSPAIKSGNNYYGPKFTSEGILA